MTSSFRRKHFHKRPEHKEDDEGQSEPLQKDDDTTAVPMLVTTPSVPPVVPTTSLTKKKKKNKAKKEAQAKEEEAKAVASSVLKKSLKQRLHARIKMKSTLRAGGSSQDVQNILEKFNDGDDEKADMMKEIQKDVQGMKQKDAKKYLKKVLGTMGKEDTDTFVDMVKDKVPSGQSSNIVNYVKRHRKIQDSDDKKKPHVNPETVYIPARLRTQDTTTPPIASTDITITHTITKRRKKGFSRVNVQVPKLADLRNHPGIEETTVKQEMANTEKKQKKKKGFSSSNLPKVVDVTQAEKPLPIPDVPLPRRKHLGGDQRTQDIERLFPDMTVHSSKEEQEASRLTYFKRIKNITTFDADKMKESMRQFMFESAAVIEILWIRNVEFLDVPEAMEIPGSQQVLEDKELPDDIKSVLPIDRQAVACDVTQNWIYKRIRPTAEDNKFIIIKSRNAYPACVEFITKFEKIRLWIQSLKGQKIPWQWFCEVLNDLGILRQKPTGATKTDQKDTTWFETFRLLCHEYKSDGPDKKLSVPIVPFVKLTLSC